MTIVAVVAMMLLLARLFSRYGVSAVAHPGVWFSAAWIAAYSSYCLMDAVGGVPFHSGALMFDLATMVIAAGAVFYLLSALPDRRATHALGATPGGLKGVRMPLAFFALAGVAGASINWVVLGASFGYSDDLRQQWLSGVPQITARTWYLYMATYPAAIASGWLICQHFLKERRLRRLEYLLIVLPAFSGLLWSLGTGGRQALGIVLLHYFSGATLSVSLQSHWRPRYSRKFVIKAVLSVSLVVLMFSAFVGITGLSRAAQQGARASSFDDYPLLAPVGQFIEYVGQPIAVHQAYGAPPRRDLSDTGPISLAGLFTFGIRDLIGWRDVDAMDTNPERFRNYASQYYPNGTRNLFYDLQADFGYAGGLAVAALLAIAGHLSFEFRRRPRARVYMTAYTPLIMLLMFWGYSNQFSLLMHDTLFWLTISVLFWDLFGVVLNDFNRNLRERG